MSSCDESSIKKNYIVQSPTDFDILSACTGIYTSNLHGCSPITTHDKLILLSGLTFSSITKDNSLIQILGRNSTTGDVEYRDVQSIISAATSQDTYVTGFTYDNINTFTINDNSGSTFNTSINVLSATTISATTYFGDGSNLSGIDNFYVTGGTYNEPTKEINFTGNSVQTTFDVDLTSLISSVSGDTFVVSGNANAGTSELTFSYNTGGTFTVTNSAALFSDNDINVTGGTYNPSNGCVTFGTNSGTTFDVCGFVTGITDTYTTGSTLVGETIQFNNNVDGLNYYNVSLSPVLSGKTNNVTFNTYTSDTQTILDGKVEDGNNVGSGTGEIFSGKSGTTLNFRTLSGGSNTTLTTIGDVVKIDVAVPSGDNFFSTAGTVTQSATTGDTAITLQIVGTSGFSPYSITGITDTFVNDFTFSSNTFTISQNDGSSFDSSLETIELGNILSAVTFDINTSGSISATTFNGDTFSGGTFYGDGSNLTGITDNDKFVSGGTYNEGTTSIDFSGNSVETTFSVSLSGISSNIDIYNTYFVSPTGDDSTAVRGDLHNPFKTITAARNKVVDELSASTVTGDTLIHVYPGSYTEDEIQYENGNFYFEPGATINQPDRGGSLIGVFNLGAANTIQPNTYTADTCNIYGHVDINLGGGSLSVAHFMRGNSESIFEFNKINIGNGFGLVPWNNAKLVAKGIEIDGQTGQYCFRAQDNSEINLNIGKVITTSNTFGLAWKSGFNGVSYVTVDEIIAPSNQIALFTETVGVDTDIVVDYGIIKNEYSGVTPTFLIQNFQQSGGKITYRGNINIKGDNGVVYNNASTGGEINILGDIKSDSTAISLTSTNTTGNTLNYGGNITTTNPNASIDLDDGSIRLDGSLNGMGGTTNGIDVSSGVNLSVGNFSIENVSGDSVTGTGSIEILNNLYIDKPLTVPTTGQYTFTGTTYDGDLNIYNTPTNDNTLTEILGRNSTTGDVEYRDVQSIISAATSQDTFVTGFTYDDANTFTINDNVGSAFTATINQVSGLTVNGTLSATTLDGSILLSGGTNLLTIIDDRDTFVTGTTFTGNQSILSRNDGSDVLKISGGTNVTITSGGTNLTVIDVTIPLDNNTFVSGGTYNDSTDIITFTNTSGGTFNVTGITDTFVTGGTYSSGTTSLDFSGNTGFVPFSVNVSELIDDTNTFVTGFTYNDTNTFTISNNNGTNYSASIDIMSGLTVNGNSVFSGTGTDVVQIYGSGSTSPLFRVEGSSGELFSISDSLIGELFAVNNISGLPILVVNSDNTILWGDNTVPSLNTTVKKSINSGLSEIYSIPVSAYTGGFFEYTVTGTGARAGSIMSIFSGTSIDFNETTTNDIGDTSGVTFDMNISGGTANLTVSATTNSWEIRTIVRSI